MTEQEPGSDTMFPDYGDLDAATRPLAADDERRALEEQRVLDARSRGREPGRRHPDPDKTPPLDDAPDYDPLPPAP